MPRQLMKGNDALSEAAVRAGCRFFGGYPITPVITSYSIHYTKLYDDQHVAVGKLEAGHALFRHDQQILVHPDEIPALADLEGADLVIGVLDHADAEARITSYNVCYTKLLRRRRCGGWAADRW